MIRLQTERLVLDPLVADDAEIMFGPLQDISLYEHFDASPPRSVEELYDRYASLERRCSPDRRERWLNWIIRQHGSTSPLGFVQATLELDGRAEIAYLLFRHEWGRGFAIEAVRATITALHHAGVETVRARIDPRNIRSRKLLESLGFEAQELCNDLSGQDVDYVLPRSLLPEFGPGK